MPKATSGGASNAWEQPQEQTSVNGDGNPVSVLEQAPLPDDVPTQGESGPGLVDLPAPDYTSMTKTALAAEAGARELPTGGTKSDLAARLAEHDAATAEAATVQQE